MNRIDRLSLTREEVLQEISEATSIKDVFRRLLNVNKFRTSEITQLNEKYEIDIRVITNENRKRLHISLRGKKTSPYGTWTCKFCGKIFQSKRLLWQHYHTEHQSQLHTYHEKGLPAWNKGLTKETSEKVRLSGERCHQHYLDGTNKPAMLGKHHTEETKAWMREFHSHATYQRVCKKTRPYNKADGTVVKLDSEYEVRLAKILDRLHLNWVRPEPLDWIDSHGKNHHYFADFLLTDYQIYLDPKNEYCFKVQAEKIDYILKHYDNVYFMHEPDITEDFILGLIQLPR